MERIINFLLPFFVIGAVYLVTLVPVKGNRIAAAYRKPSYLWFMLAVISLPVAILDWIVSLVVRKEK